MDRHVAQALIHKLEAQLPNAQQRFNEHLSEDEAFGEIFSEYEECAKCLAYWQSSAQQHQDRTEEYVNLLRELEREILGILGDKPQG